MWMNKFSQNIFLKWDCNFILNALSKGNKLALFNCFICWQLSKIILKCYASMCFLSLFYLSLSIYEFIYLFLSVPRKKTRTKDYKHVVFCTYYHINLSPTAITHALWWYETPSLSHTHARAFVKDKKIKGSLLQSQHLSDLPTCRP